MLWSIAAVLVVLWTIGLVTSTTLSGFIHVLIVLAVILVAFRLFQGPRIVV